MARRLYQRGKRQRDDAGGKDRQQDGAAQIKDGAEQNDEDAKGSDMGERRPHHVRPSQQRIGSEFGVGDFTAGVQVFHWHGPHPSPSRRSLTRKQGTGSRRAAAGAFWPLRRATGLLEGAP